jgi:hypothetical protein
MIKSRRMRWAGHVVCTEELINAYKILFENPEGRRLLERPRRRWEDNIKIDIKAIGWERVDWIDLAQDSDRWWALVDTLMNLWDSIRSSNSVTE